ncbi:MAG: glycosyltransferase family 4 protein [Acidimicrobiales bacterium]|jgi:phosphatidylinositol alpha-mannosyltransferase
MRVALVCGYDWAVPGGAQGQVAALSGALARRGETVAVVTPQTAPGRGPQIEGVRLYRAGHGISIPANGSVAPVAPTPAAAMAAVRALRDFAPDVVHVHEPLVPGPPLAAVLAGPRPIVATFHRADSDLLYRVEGRLFGAIAGRRLAVATGVSAEAIETSRVVLGSHLPRVVEVGNGVEVERFERARADREAHSAGLGPYKNGEAPVVAFVGRLERRKGVSVLLDAMGSLGVEAQLVVGGDGPEAFSLRKAVEADPRVRFLGRVDDGEVASVMAAADVFVAPATGGESFGVVLLEAMAAGTAVVASDIPGYTLAAAGAARLFRSGNARDLARVIGEVLGDHRARAELVASGLVRAQACSIDKIAECYLEVYESVVVHKH